MHGGDLVDEGFAFGGGQLIGVRDGLGGGAAVLAGKITGLCDFPDGEEWGLVVIQPAAGGYVVHGLLHRATSELKGSALESAGERPYGN